MPTPVSTARQCLADEAAAALDDAVSVAKRRGHAQTTSLHGVSALLSLPSSLLRDACSRASGRGGACPPRFQLRALDLCVVVALDRVPTSKHPLDDDPPVSNSLMAAIKRSQANQRRSPETFHQYQQLLMMNPDSDHPSSSFNTSVVRVDLKNFVMSILDDPNVSKVFGDAGFRNQEIKCAILNPSPLLRFPSFPPLLGDFGAKGDYSGRIGEVMMRKDRRNPLLIGACADDALKGFLEDVKRGEIVGNIEKMSVVSIETEVTEFLAGGLSEEVLGMRFKEVCEMVESCVVLLSLGDMKVFVNMEMPKDKVYYLVGEIKKLLSEYGGRLWWIGALGSDYEYKKLLEQFPEIEEEWDLHLLPITGYSSSGRKGFKSSLMGSFVPLGGFFPLPSDDEAPCTRKSQSADICSSCNGKYEQEVNILQKGASSNLDSDRHITLSPWLKESGQVLAKDVKTSMDAKVVALYRKWTDICQQLHHSWTSKGDVSPSKTQNNGVLSLCSTPSQMDSPRLLGSHLNASEAGGPRHCTPLDLNRPLQSQIIPDGIPDFRSIRTMERNHIQVSSPQRGNQMGKKDLEYPWKVLAERVYWQIDAVETLGQTMTRHRGDGVYTFLNKGNIWLSFLGPDILGKRLIAAAVADIVFGNKQMLSFDLSSTNLSRHTVFDCCDTISHNVKPERKMIVDSLAEELNKHPRSVVILDNVEKADPLLQNSLFQSVKTGKFRDSHGRDININNMVFILASRFDMSVKGHSAQITTPEYSEDKIVYAKNFEMQILIASPNEIHRKDSSTNVCVSTSKEPSNQRPLKRRKSTSNKDANVKMSRSIIDLNLPVEDTEDSSDIDKPDDDDDVDDDDDGSISSESFDNPDTWLSELLELVDLNVHFKPLNCDSLALKILNKIDTRLHKFVGSNTFLEIDREVMHQILAAAMLADSEAPLNDWIENVLCPAIKEARQRQRHDTHSNTVVRLVSCDGLVVEELAHGLCLPAKIRVN